MASKVYWLRFGSDNPANKTGLSPTFIKFLNSAGAATTAPAITEPGSAGLYQFSYDPQGPIGFIVDGGASLTGADRYIAGSLDVNDKISEVGGTLSALGSSLGAISATLIAQGATLVAIGNTSGAMAATLVAQGATLVAIGNTVAGIGVTLSGVFTGIGDTTSSFGTDAADPTTVFGFLKRIQELHEGNSDYAKGTGIWRMYSRGSSQLLRSKTLADGATNVTKT